MATSLQVFVTLLLVTQQLDACQFSSNSRTSKILKNEDAPVIDDAARGGNGGGGKKDQYTYVIDKD